MTTKDTIRRVMRKADALFLATNGRDGFPAIRAVFNLRNEEQFPSLAFLNQDEDDFSVWIGTNASSRKVEEMRRDPRVSAYYCLPSELQGFMMIGEVEEVRDEKTKERVWVEGWERYYPSGPGDSDYALLRMRPERVEGWLTPRRFEMSLP